MDKKTFVIKQNKEYISLVTPSVSPNGSNSVRKDNADEVLLIENGSFVNSFFQNDTNNKSHTFINLDAFNYNATVGALNGAGIYRWSNIKYVQTDFTAPTIIATPNKTVITNYPVLKAWTNEKAVCYYNYSSSLVEFAYTNTSYHETKLSFLNNNHYDYVITCYDLAQNFDIQAINFTVDSTLQPETIVVDMRNHYESEVGHFDEAILPDTDSFRETLAVVEKQIELQPLETIK